MSDTTQWGNFIFPGSVAFTGAIYVPVGSFDDDDISNNANKRINDNKVIHRPDLLYAQADGANVVSETKLLRVCQGAGALLSVHVRPTTAPVGGDKKFTVDVQKAADGSAVWTSLLSAPLQIAAGDANNTIKAAVLAGSVATALGEAIRIVITASGATGSQGQGVQVTCAYREQSSF